MSAHADGWRRQVPLTEPLDPVYAIHPKAGRCEAKSSAHRRCVRDVNHRGRKHRDIEGVEW